jgi:hypothetical protein
VSIAATMDHIKKTVSAFPTSILTSFPDLGNAGFTDADRMGGTRIPLGAMVGRSRVFEAELDGVTVVPLQVGQSVPTAFNFTATLRVRYDAQGLAVKDEVKQKALREQIVIIKALNASNWPAVSGLITFVSRSGTIATGAAVDEGGAEFNFVLSEILVDCSVDM